MSKIKLLDCTLRDGGYINNWSFGSSVIKDICAKLSSAKMDIIEVGFLTDMAHDTEQSLYSSCDELEERCGFGSDISLHAAMIAIGEKEMDPASLPAAEKTSLDIVRITFHRTDAEIDKSIRYARCLMDKGYKVCMQPVGTTSYTDKQLLELIEKINELKPYAFYLVDTLGILCKEELLRFLYLIDYNLSENILIGFHSHNNLQMSFANAQFIIDYHSSREFIIDCSVYGMGRGAGNLCTELIAWHVNNTGMSSYNMVSIYEILDEYIYPIRLKHEWGYNYSYFIAAVHKCHPNYAAYLMNKQTLTMNEIDLILKNLSVDKRDVYDKSLIESLYYNFQDHRVDDMRSLSELKELLKGKTILLLAPGYSINQYSDSIHQFIEDNSPVVITINGQFNNYHSDMIFISNLKRLYRFEKSSQAERVIVTSNLPKIINDCLYVDYSRLCSKESDESDNSGLMLIRLMIEIGISELYIAGFDGFDSVVTKNYFSDTMINSVSPENISGKNSSIKSQFNIIKKQIRINTLTPSLYF